MEEFMLADSSSAVAKPFPLSNPNPKACAEDVSTASGQVKSVEN
jgi:hypothetical protein